MAAWDALYCHKRDTFQLIDYRTMPQRPTLKLLNKQCQDMVSVSLAITHISVVLMSTTTIYLVQNI